MGWGDLTVDTYTLSPGTTSFSVSHQYLDDNPTVTAFDDYPVTWTITDNDGGSDTDSGTVRVSNVYPPTWQ